MEKYMEKITFTPDDGVMKANGKTQESFYNIRAALLLYGIVEPYIEPVAVYTETTDTDALDADGTLQERIDKLEEELATANATIDKCAPVIDFINKITKRAETAEATLAEYETYKGIIEAINKLKG